MVGLLLDLHASPPRAYVASLGSSAAFCCAKAEGHVSPSSSEPLPPTHPDSFAPRPQPGFPQPVLTLLAGGHWQGGPSGQGAHGGRPEGACARAEGGRDGERHHTVTLTFRGHVRTPWPLHDRCMAMAWHQHYLCIGRSRCRPSHGGYMAIPGEGLQSAVTRSR